MRAESSSVSVFEMCTLLPKNIFWFQLTKAGAGLGRCFKAIGGIITHYNVVKTRGHVKMDVALPGEIFIFVFLITNGRAALSLMLCV